MLPEFTMNAKRIASMNLKKKKKRLERFLFYLNPDKMYTMRELPDLLPPKTEETAPEKKRTTKK